MGAISSKNNSISQERYIELKEMAYRFYEEYNSLDRQARRSYLEVLPQFDNPVENSIIRTTLLFPDTLELLTAKPAELSKMLKKQGSDLDDATGRDLVFKVNEYQLMGTYQLVTDGKLKVMDELKHEDCSIIEKVYLSLKNEALEARDEFLKLDLSQKVKFVKSITEDINYNTQIQLATLLIPDDAKLIEQLKRNSVADLATYYKVPESLIEFKKDEYSMQGTKTVIPKFKISKTSTPLSKLWYKDDLEADLIPKIWDQSFYRGIETEHMNNIEADLSKIYAKPTTKKTTK